MTIADINYTTRDSLEVMRIRREREAERSVNKEIDAKVNEAVQKYLADGTVGTWCTIS